VNRLEGSPSLYLRQHATNPVDWWPWGDAAFDEARERDVPVLLSVGYAACHWCHVMAHECFEDPIIAELINEITVPIKVDREEYPDVDALYMSATQAMNGHGGWPMTVFLTPDREPFFAGTYFPPIDRHGQPGFPRILASIGDVWRNRRSDVLEQAAHLTSAVRKEATLLDSLAPTDEGLSARALLVTLVETLSERFDPQDGGFSPAPKFPHPGWVEACLALSSVASRNDASMMATTTLDAMARGGLFDHIAGGFARYSVDATWSVPHFEKMLSDQALLARCYLRAGAWLHEPAYTWVARRTIDFVLDQMRVKDGFASAMDADAEGQEGGHVLLTATDVSEILEDAGLAGLAARTVDRYGLSDDGPVDGACVPRLDMFSDLVGDEDDDLVRTTLLEARAFGPQPSVDDKVLLEWTAMFASVLAEAAWRLDDDRYASEAVSTVESLSRTHLADGRWYRRSGPQAPLATSADLGWLIDARVSLFELTGDRVHLERATEVFDALLDGHWDGVVPQPYDPEVGSGLFQTHRDAAASLVRAKDVLDGAVPSGSSIAALALARLGLVASDGRALAVADRLVQLAAPVLDRQPHAAVTMVEAACYLTEGLEVAVPGEMGGPLAEVRSSLPPFSVLAFGSAPIALLEEREAGLVYICRNATCSAPIASLDSVVPALADAAHWSLEE
jgi:hypothetical protein